MACVLMADAGHCKAVKDRVSWQPKCLSGYGKAQSGCVTEPTRLGKNRHPGPI
jgi:hypothetical protein